MSSTAILLGPYRNLSTLTAAALALHPNVQTLNHGAVRLWRDQRLDFVGDPQALVYRQFLAAALRESEGGRRGNYGGSILLSHAFEEPLLKQVYDKRYGGVVAKAAPRCLVWKDSMVIQRRLAADAALLPAIITKLPDVRFVLPIRQPIDCALSNIRTGHAKHLLAEPARATVEDVLDAVLNAIVWVLRQRDRWPDRFFVFTERVDSGALANDLSQFLDLPDDASWRDDFGTVFRPRQKDGVPAHLTRMEQGRIRETLAPWPEIRDGLLR